MSMTIRRYVPLILTFLAGMLMLSDFYIQNPTISGATRIVTGWSVILVSLAVVLAVVSSVLMYLRRLMKRQDLTMTIVYLATLFGVLGIGMILGEHHVSYLWIIEYLRTPPEQAVYGLMVFYYATILFRILRMRSVEGLLVTLPFFIILIANTPLGVLAFPSSEPIKSWLLAVPFNGVLRALVIGAAIAGIVLGVRTLLGLERGYLREGT